MSRDASNPFEIDQLDALKIGDTIGGTYLIKSLLGRGGMGQVFAVEH